MNPFAIGVGANVKTATVERRSGKGRHLDRLRSLGLLGCIEGPPDLAQNRKKYVRQALRAKYRAR